MGTCEIKLFWNNFEIIPVFYFTCNDVWNWNKIFQPLKEFSNYFKLISATLNKQQNIHWATSKIISDEHWWRLKQFWNNYILHVTGALYDSNLTRLTDAKLTFALSPVDDCANSSCSLCASYIISCSMSRGLAAKMNSCCIDQQTTTIHVTFSNHVCTGFPLNFDNKIPWFSLSKLIADFPDQWKPCCIVQLQLVK